MWSVVAVTRGGWGEVWGFDSYRAAQDHPLVQEGDAVVTSPETTLEVWNYLLLPRLLDEVLGDRRQSQTAREEILTEGTPWDRAMARSRMWSSTAWDMLRRAARRPPEDSKALCEKIREDRRLYDDWRRREETRRTSVTKTNDTAATAATAAAEAKPKTIAGKSPTAKIAFGKDKDNKPYNTTDNNPKRAKSGERFAKYAAGQTLEAAVAAGVTPADIKWDIDKGFITVS